MPYSKKMIANTAFFIKQSVNVTLVLSQVSTALFVELSASWRPACVPQMSLHVALHPGVVGTEVWRSLPWPLDAIIKRFMITPQQGAATTLFCATDASLASESGHYYDKCRQARHSRLGDDVELAAELWRRSKEWVLRHQA